MAVTAGSVTGKFFYPDVCCNVVIIYKCRVHLYIISVMGSHRFSITRLVQSLIMVQAVEEVNKRHVLGNLTLGYSILDSCSDVTTALISTQAFMRRNGE